jgi:hypothetical protein
VCVDGGLRGVTKQNCLACAEVAQSRQCFDG